MVYTNIDNGLHIRPQHLSPESIGNFLAKRAGRYRKILIPLGGELLRENVLGLAVGAARLTSAELVLLIVRPPIVSKKYVPNLESLFTALKGLQAQLQSCRVRVRFDSVTGPTASSIIEYAAKNSIDLIVMAGQERDAETGDDVAATVMSAAHCPTFIIREN